MGAGGHGLSEFGDLRELFVVEFDAEAGAVVGVEFSILEIETDGQMRSVRPWKLYSMSTGPEKVPSVLTSAAVAMGPVKCGTMPTKWVSQMAVILSISVMPPTLGSVARMKSIS